jgi:FkbM family methyltransferase
LPSDSSTSVGLNIESAIRKWRDGFIDSLVATRHFKRSVYRSLSQNGRLILCRLDDHDIAVDPNDFVGRTLLEKGNFDRARTEIVARRAHELTGRRTVLEVGANIGTQTIYFLKSGVVDRVVSLEPDPKNVRTLETNLHLNRLTDRVVLLPVAAGAAPDVLTLQREWGNSGAATLRSEKLSERMTEEVQVPVVTLDSLADDGTLDYGDIGLLWIDAEGYEEEIFQGAPALLARKIPLAFEFSPVFYSAEKAGRIIDMVFSAYDHVSIVDDNGFRPTTRAELAALTRQADVFCHG